MRKSMVLVVIGIFFGMSSFSFAGQSDFGLVNAKGVVDVAQIGGKGLYVFSMWNGGRKSLIGPDGSFSVSILSSARPQKLSVKDTHEKTRALALVLSQGSGKIVFDSESTAMAILFSDPGAIKNAGEMEHSLKVARASRSFGDLVSFFKKNLGSKTIEELISDDQYLALFKACKRELFNVDSDQIEKSLNKAQGELEESFYGK